MTQLIDSNNDIDKNETRETLQTSLPESSQEALSVSVSPDIIPPSKSRIDWVSSTFIVSMHIFALAGFFTFSWKALAVCLVLHWVTGGLGITLGFHRLLTHRSFQVPKFLEYFFAIVGSLACQAGPITWVSAHRLHHAKSDQEGDPHSPVKGFFWAHMGWCMTRNPIIDTREGKTKWASDLTKDPVMVFIEKTHILWTLLLGSALYAMGGWPFVVWGVCVRLVFVYHCTWLVNSAAHIWGYRTYKTTDQSTNLWWVALLTYGEGWHNNHHAFQYSARHGMRWWEIDTTYYTIKILEWLKLAKTVRIPSEKLLTGVYAPGVEEILNRKKY